MESSIELSEKTVAILNDFRNAAYQMRDIAQRIKIELIESGVISSTDSYSDIKNFVGLQKALLLAMAMGLPKTIGHESKYGCNIVSDFDLYWNMSSDSDFDKFLESIDFDKNKVRNFTLYLP